jgi:acetyl esterase/lipase
MLLDLIVPQTLPKALRPLVVWLCGGAWLSLDKGAHILELKHLAEAGYIVASVDYRTSNQVHFPGPLEDVKAAIRYLRAHAAIYGIDPDRVAVMGESAGGHLAEMVGVTGDLADFDTGDWLDFSSKVQAVVDWYGPSDFTTMRAINSEEGNLDASPEYLLAGTNMKGDPEVLRGMSPVNFVTANTPPFLILHGNADTIVPFSQSEQLYEALEAKNVYAELYEIEGASHADIHFSQPMVQKIIRDFLDEHLKN